MEVSGGSQKGPWTQSAKGWAVPELPPGDGLPALSCQGPFPPPLSPPHSGVLATSSSLARPHLQLPGSLPWLWQTARTDPSKSKSLPSQREQP